MSTIPFGTYRHFKGDLYEVIGLARHSEDHTELVVYRALYRSHALWVRPLTKFLETVVVGEQQIPRFQYVERGRGGDMTPKQERHLLDSVIAAMYAAEGGKNTITPAMARAAIDMVRLHDSFHRQVAMSTMPEFPAHANDVHLRYFPEPLRWVCWIDSPTFWDGPSAPCELARGEHPTDPWKALQAAVDTAMPKQEGRSA